jgi:hypothetical protein
LGGIIIEKEYLFNEIMVNAFSLFFWCSFWNFFISLSFSLILVPIGYYISWKNENKITFIQALKILVKSFLTSWIVNTFISIILGLMHLDIKGDFFMQSPWGILLNCLITIGCFYMYFKSKKDLELN